MPIRMYRPTSPGRRGMSVSTFEEITRSKPERSLIEKSVIMSGVHVGKGCTIRRAIVDEHCDIPDGMQIGVDLALDQRRFDVTPRGVVLVTPAALQAAQG